MEGWRGRSHAVARVNIVLYRAVRFARLKEKMPSSPLRKRKTAWCGGRQQPQRRQTADGMVMTMTTMACVDILQAAGMGRAGEKPINAHGQRLR